MRFISGYLLFGVVFLSAFVADAKTIEVVDDIGRTVQLDKPARRIVSLAPHITENLFSAGVGQFVAGAVSYSDYPIEARAIASVGGYDNFDSELILALQPDLVIGWKEGNQFHQVEKLIDLGLAVFVNEPQRLADVAADIIRFGILGGREDEARAVAQEYLDGISRLRDQHSALEKVSVFYQVWPNPLITVTDSQIIGNVIELCGGSNIFAGLGSPNGWARKQCWQKTRTPSLSAAWMKQDRTGWMNGNNGHFSRPQGTITCSSSIRTSFSAILPGFYWEQGNSVNSWNGREKISVRPERGAP